uniref:Mitochondrial fission 1 protein n=1 Tax=Pipistrellus kuhlii TaxID=59472 RepID=A0A7J7YW13_PIPKU|nr:fission, mitochondrial 1 [Pipistrellus kuhlii]
MEIPGWRTFGWKKSGMKTSPCTGRVGAWRGRWRADGSGKWRRLIPEDWKNTKSEILFELLLKGSKEEQRDYVFYLAVGNYRLKEYEKALKYVRGLLQTEPQNNQAKELERLIDKAMKKDGLVGMAIVGGMALGVAGLAGLIGFAVSKSKS